MKVETTCIVLSGGKSARMGRNKSFLKFRNKTIIENTIQLMTSIFKKVIVITNEPEKYKHLGISIYKDIYKEKGPLAGIHSGLINSKSERNFIISCDLPLMVREIIDFISEHRTEKQITICKLDGYLQPHLGVYSKSLIPIIDTIFASESKKSLFSLLDMVDHEIIEIDKLDFFRKEYFLNMNRPEDYQEIIFRTSPSPK